MRAMITALPVNHMVGLHSTVSDCMLPTYQQIHALDHKKSAPPPPLRESGASCRPPDIRNARLQKKKQGGIPCRERIRKIFPCLLLGLIYFVKVK